MCRELFVEKRKCVWMVYGGIYNLFVFKEYDVVDFEVIIRLLMIGFILCFWKFN